MFYPILQILWHHTHLLSNCSNSLKMVTTKSSLNIYFPCMVTFRSIQGPDTIEVCLSFLSFPLAGLIADIAMIQPKLLVFVVLALCSTSATNKLSRLVCCFELFLLRRRSCRREQLSLEKQNFSQSKIIVIIASKVKSIFFQCTNTFVEP